MNSGKIFISYRREDTSGESGRLKDKLEQIFGAENIFYDVETLEAGLNFDESISKALSESKVLLAMIGPHWLRVTDAEGKPRIQKNNDWVRKEIGMALGRNIRVIPVLVNGAQMPDPESMPDDLHELSLKHAQEISSSRWNYDVGELIKVLEKIVPPKKKEPFSNSGNFQNINRPPLPPKPKSWWAKNYLWVLGGIVGFLVLINLLNPNPDPTGIDPIYNPNIIQVDSTEYEGQEPISPSGNMGGGSQADPRVNNPNGNEIYNSLTFEKIPEFSGKWWLYENDIRSGFFQIRQNGAEFTFDYYLFNVQVGKGNGYFDDGYLVTESFTMKDTPGNYGFSFISPDEGKTWKGEIYSDQQTSPAYLVKD
ncbi:MAG: hypothetical protein B7Z16_01040 [Algoriphagus sp. 32-45-6]|nr:MAG: hypothetical protein B7Z16_01040 [Algoriphagus sp. 32-45-6]